MTGSEVPSEGKSSKPKKVKKKKTLRERLINLSISLLVTFLMLLVGEFIVRALYKDTMVLFPRYHTDFTYGDYTIRGIRPNMAFTHTSVDGEFDFVTNNKGFRSNKDIQYEKGEGEVRILCLGDSHTQGYEVQQSQVFTAVLERLFEKDGKKVTAINEGVSGSGTAEQLVFLMNEGYKYHPDFVTLGFYKNDFDDNVRSNLFVVRNDSLMPKSYAYIPGVKIQNFIYRFGLFRWLGENSYLYGLCFNTIWDSMKKSKIDESRKDAAKYNEYAVADDSEVQLYNKQLEVELIREMYRYCHDELGVPLIIVDIPRVGIKSSIPDDILTDFRANSDTLFYTPDLKADYAKLSKVHVKHGHRHISSEAHAMIARKIFRYVNSYKRE